MSIVDSLLDLINILLDGLSTFIDFVIYLPNMIHSLLVVLPEPFYTVTVSFIGLIIFLIIVYVVAKLMSTVKGG